MSKTSLIIPLILLFFSNLIRASSLIDFLHLRSAILFNDLASTKRYYEKGVGAMMQYREELVFLSINSPEILEFMILEKGISANITDRLGDSLLIHAVNSNALASVKFLCEKTDVNLEFKSKDEQTILHVVCLTTNLEMMEYIISKPKVMSNSNAKDVFGSTAFDYVIKSKNERVMTYFNDGLHFNMFAMYAFEKACFTNDLSAVQQFFVENTEVADLVRALHSAIRGNAIEVLGYLIEAKKALIYDYAPAIIAASKYSNLHVVKYLHENAGVTYNATHFAYSCGRLVENIEVVRYLSNLLGNHIYPQSIDAPNPLFYALSARNYGVAKFLLAEKNFDAKSKNADGCTPLHFACSHGSLSMTKFLIEELPLFQSHTLHFSNLETDRVNINALNEDHKTPLFLAVENYGFEVAEYLIETAGADISIPGKQSKTVLHLASELGQLKTVKLLVQKKVIPLDAIDGLRYTPLHYACKSGDLETVQFLIEECYSSAIVVIKDKRSILKLAEMNQDHRIKAHLTASGLVPDECVIQ